MNPQKIYDCSQAAQAGTLAAGFDQKALRYDLSPGYDCSILFTCRVDLFEYTPGHFQSARKSAKYSHSSAVTGRSICVPQTLASLIMSEAKRILVLSLQLPEYVNIFNQIEPGHLESKSSLQFKLDGPLAQSILFNVDQTIRLAWHFLDMLKAGTGGFEIMRTDYLIWNSLVPRRNSLSKTSP